MKYTDNWLNDWDQREVVCGKKSSQRPGTSSIPQGSVLDLIIFNTSINDPDDRAGGNFNKLVDDTNLESG